MPDHSFSVEERRERVSRAAPVRHDRLTLERTAHNCAVSSKTIERIILPSLTKEGERAPALRWGAPPTMALFTSLTAFVAAPEGFRNRTLRERVAALHDPGANGYTAAPMTYDLRRLRLKRIIRRVPRSHRYELTPLGRRDVIFMSKTYARVARPILHRMDPAVPDNPTDNLRRAWTSCNEAIDAAIDEARIAAREPASFVWILAG